MSTEPSSGSATGSGATIEERAEEEILSNSEPYARTVQGATVEERAGGEIQPPPLVGWRRWPRVALRATLVTLWTLAITIWLVSVCGIGALLPGPSDRRRAPLRRKVARAWGRGMMFALRIRIECEGTPPPPGALLVANHLSYLDIPALNSIVPAVFVAKAEVKGWPVWGFLSNAADTVFVNRAAKRDILRVRSEMTRALARGDIVAVFPEATSTAGRTIIPFRPPLLADAAATRTPVHWVTLSYRTPPGEPSAQSRLCWWGDVGFLPHLAGVMALKRASCTVRFGDAPIVDGDRKALAATLRKAMLRRFVPSGSGRGDAPSQLLGMM